MSRCTDIRKLISSRLDGDISPIETHDINEHLRTCKECKKYLEIQKILKDTVREVPGVTPGEINDRLKKILPERKKEKISAWIPGPAWKPALAGAFAILFISSILYLSAKDRMNLFSVARNEEQIMQTLSEEEREFLIFLEENSGKDGDDFLEMLQELDDLEELLSDGKVST